MFFIVSIELTQVYVGLDRSSQVGAVNTASIVAPARTARKPYASSTSHVKLQC